ncbi:MAG: glycosyltransferase family 39 protein [Chamaesiphon sp.]
MKFSVDRFIAHWEQQPKLTWILSILCLLFIGWMAFFWGLGSIGLIDETEPLFAEASRQMTVTGDWITPYFNDATRFDKPPLIYWLQAIAYYILGVNEWAVRLPSALSALALTVLGFYTLRYFGIPHPSAVQKQEIDTDSINKTSLERQLWLSAWLGSIMIALNALTIGTARMGAADMLLVLCMGGAMFTFFLGYATSKEAAKARWYLGFYVLLALAILAKGPVGIVLPGLIIAAFVLYLGNSREVLREMRLLSGGLIMLAVALPWYVLVTWKNGASFINSFFLYHNIERFTSVVNHHAGPWYIYFPVIFLGFAPWCIYLPIAIARLRFWERKNWQSQPRSTQLSLFALFWLAIIFVFFSIAVTKRANYVLPSFPAAATLVALLWSDLISRPERTKTKAGLGMTWSAIFNVVLLLAFAGATFYSPNFIGYDPAVPDLRSAIEASGLTTLGGIIWGVSAIAVVLLIIVRRLSWIWSANFIGFLACLIFIIIPASFVVDRVRQMPLRELSALVTQVKQPGEELIMIGFEKPSVVFYTRQHVNYFVDPQDAIKYIETRTATQHNSQSVLILSQSDILHSSKLQPNQYKNLGKAGPYELIRVTKQVVASL